MKVSFQGVNDISAKNYHDKARNVVGSEVKFKLDNIGENHLEMFSKDFKKSLKQDFVGNEVCLKCEQVKHINGISPDKFYINGINIHRRKEHMPLFTRAANILGYIHTEKDIRSFDSAPKRFFLVKPTSTLATNIFKGLECLDVVDSLKTKFFMAVIQSITGSHKKIQLKY